MKALVSNQQLDEKKLYYLGFLPYILLIIFSIVFYKERTVVFDNAYYIFDMVQSGKFCIERNRFISIIPQIFSYLFIKLNAPIKWVAISFSIGHCLYSIVIYTIIGQYFKNYKNAISLLLYDFLLVSYTFYWNVSELYLAIPLLLLLITWIQSKPLSGLSWIEYLIILLMSATVAYAHPLIIFPLAFLLIYFYLDQSLPIEKVGFVLFSILIFYIFNRIFPLDNYESGKISALKNIVHLFPHYIDISSNRLLIYDWMTHYQAAIIAWMAIMIFSIRQKKYVQLLVLNIFIFGYLLMTNISFSDIQHSIFFSILYLPIALFLSIALVYILPNSKKTLILFLLIFLFGFYRINYFKKLFSDRIQWYTEVIKENHYSNIAIASKLEPPHLLYLNWCVPFETWLLSTMDYGHTSSIIFLEQLNEQPQLSPDLSNQFLGVWANYSLNSLPKKYFKYKDNKISYVVIR